MASGRRGAFEPDDGVLEPPGRGIDLDEMANRGRFGVRDRLGQWSVECDDALDRYGAGGVRRRSLHLIGP